MASLKSDSTINKYMETITKISLEWLFRVPQNKRTPTSVQLGKLLYIKVNYYMLQEYRLKEVTLNRVTVKN